MPVTTSTTLTNQFQNYFSKELLSIVQQETILDQFAQKVLPIIRDLKAAGYTSLRQIAAALTERQVQTVRGSINWSASQVSNIIAREAA